MASVPALLEKSVGKEESHVDAHGGAKGGKDHVLLLGDDIGAPPLRVRGGSDERLIHLGGFSKKGEVWQVAHENLSPRQGSCETDDHCKEGEDDDTDHELHDPVKELSALSSRLVEVIDVQSDCEKG